MVTRKRQCYRQCAGKAGATDQQSQEKQDVENLITTPTQREGHEQKGADDRAPEDASMIHNYSGYAGGAAQIPQANPINDKYHPILTTNIHNSSDYAGGAAQILYANDINDKSRPNLTTNIHNFSGYAGGAAQIPLANAINDRSHPTIHQVTLEVLPKFYRQMILMTSLVPIRP